MNPELLTKYRSGSVREIFSLAWPLMICIMSGNIMFFTDRWLLSWYSLEAMNAVSVVNSIVAVFQFAPLSITSISEVFVGQFNGASRYKEIGKPVWQMLWLSLGLMFFYLPIAYWGSDYLSPYYKEEGAPYFQLMMGTAYLMPMMGALSGFYAGRGQVKILTISAVISNIVNGLLAALFIFGAGFVPALGTKGAALATICAQALNASILLGVFLKPTFRKKYNTHHFTFDKKLFLDCVRIGLPNGMSHTVEFASWSILVNCAAALGSTYITVSAISSSFFVLFLFLVEGLQKSVMAISSNLIGAKEVDKISKVLRSGLKMHMMTTSIIFIPLVLFSNKLVPFFVHDPQVIEALMSPIRWSLFFVWAFLALDGINWVFCGILTSAGDTKFILKTNTINILLFSFLPTYYFVIIQKGSPVLLWGLGVPYALAGLTIFSWRYRSNIWKKKSIE
jgi:MATE family multidrug resistance protein